MVPLLGVFIMFAWLILLITVLVIYFFAGIRVVNKHEKAAVFTLGRFAGVREPGFRFIFVIFQKMIKADMRLKTPKIDEQLMADNALTDIKV